MPEFSLDTIAEVSVTLAGFSGLAAAFRTRQMRDWVEWERIWFWYVLTWSLGALLFALLPAVVLGLGVSATAGWASCSGLLVLFIAGAMGQGVRRGLRLYRAGAPHPRARIVWVAVLPAVGAVGLLLLSLSGLGTPVLGAYQLALYVILALACGSFLLFLQYPLSE